MSVKEFKGTLPSKKAEELAQRAATQEQEKNSKEAAFKSAVARLANTEDGRTLLRWLKNECGFGDSYLGVNPSNGEIDPLRTTYAAMRLNLWWKIRKYLPLKQLIEVEHE
jgi:hypothetical protein